jgi:glycosyltransferase involved in cell wall biosynthesis
MRVCIFVRNTFTVDARVLRQARSISAAGHETLVIAMGSKDLPETEERDGFRVRRVSPALTWEDGIPRLTKLKRSVVRKQRAEPPRPAEPSTRAATRAGSWRFTWLLTGAGPPPRSWPNGSKSTLSERATFTAKLVARAPARRARRATRVASRAAKKRSIRAKRKLLRPSRFRQIERRMAREAVAFKPDVCWSNDTDTLRAAASAARSTGARLVYDAHEVMWDVPQLKWNYKLRWSLVERTHIRRAAACSTVCDPIADLMAERYRIPRPAVILNTPALAESEHATSPADSPLNAHRRPGELIVCYTGNLAPYRGLEELFAAMPHLPANARLVIIGYGFYRDTLERLARDQGLAERVSILDPVPAQELLHWVAGADVGMVSHLRRGRNQEYVMPNKLFEFMHLGIPVVANDLPLVTPIVREVGFGEVVDITDAPALAHAIAGLLEDPARRAEMRERALAGARRYSWENQERTVLDMVEGRPDGHQKL